MRQRNDTTTAWHFAATDDAEACTVAPGETTHHPVLLDGWSPAADPAPKTRTKKTTDTTDSEGEPQ